MFSRATATTGAAASRARAAATRSAPTCTGPLLPKNAWFADWLIARALGARAGRARGARRRARARSASQRCTRRARRRGRLRRRRADRPQSRRLRRATSAGRAHTIRRVELAEYQRLSRRTAEYPREAWLTYPALGLAGEAGEVAEHAKKAIRDDGGEVTTSGVRRWPGARRRALVCRPARERARPRPRRDRPENLEKLLSRQRRGVLSGSGDDR